LNGLARDFSFNQLALTQDPISREPGSAATVRDDSSSMVSAVRLLSVVLRHRGLIAGLAFAVFTFAAVRALLRERTYTATATLIAEGTKSASPVSGIAAQLGIALPAGAAGQSPSFYVELLKSRDILRPVAEAKYKFRGRDGAVEADLATIYEAGGATPAIRRDEAVRLLSKNVLSALSARSSIISFTVTAPAAELAAQIASRIIDEVNRFNLERRQSAVRAERTFTERRLAEANSTLREAENKQQEFLSRNRLYASSPDLLLEFQRLAREVLARQAIASSLGQAYEQSKIEEVRDTPVITVLEAPEPPSRPDERGALAGALIGLLVGAILGLAIAFGREWSSRTRVDAIDDFAEFDVLRRQTLRDLRHPLAAVARASRRLGRSSANAG